MIYDSNFLENVSAFLQKEFGSGYTVDIQNLPKNNGIVLSSVTIRQPECSISPVVYLDSYYTEYQQGSSMDEILHEISATLHANEQPPADIEPKTLLSYEANRKKISFRLVNAAYNETRLQSLPHKKYLDLAIIFSIFLGRTETGVMSTVIDNTMLSTWGISVDQLMQDALANMPSLMPAIFRSINDVLAGLIQQKHPDSALASDLLPDSNPFYVLSNTSGIYGAASILYPGQLEQLSIRFHSDLIVIPSSVHEVLIIPDVDPSDIPELYGMVKTVNQTSVLPEERLSNTIYRYSHRDHLLEIAPRPERRSA